MRKNLAVLMVLFVTGSLLAGCSGGGGSTTAAATTAAPAAATAAPSETKAEAPATEAAASGESYTFSIGTYNPENSADGVAAEAFKAYVEDKSGGKISVDVYHNSTLGDSQTQIEAVSMGSQDFFVAPMEHMTLYSPLFNVPQTYFLFENIEQLKAFYNSDIFKPAVQALSDANTLLMDKTWVGQQGPFRVLCSTKPIKSYDDIKGLKCRVYDTPAQYATWEAFGTAPYLVSYTEIYLALEQGMIEAVEVPFNVVNANSYCDVTKYITKFETFYQLYNIIGNKKKVESLPEDLQKVLYDGAAAGMQAYADNVKEQLDADLEFLQKEKGVTYFDQLDYAPFRDAMGVAYEKLYASGNLDKDIVEAVKGLK